MSPIQNTFPAENSKSDQITEIVSNNFVINDQPDRVTFVDKRIDNVQLQNKKPMKFPQTPC